MLPKYSDIVDLIKKGATVEAQEKIMQLREAALELQEENIVLKDMIKELKKELEVKGRVEYDQTIYYLWLEDDAGDLTIKDGPYCQRCYDVDQKLVRLQELQSSYFCVQCGIEFRKPQQP